MSSREQPDETIQNILRKRMMAALRNFEPSRVLGHPSWKVGNSLLSKNRVRYYEARKGVVQNRAYLIAFRVAIRINTYEAWIRFPGQNSFFLQRSRETALPRPRVIADDFLKNVELQGTGISAPQLNAYLLQRTFDILMCHIQ